MAESKAKTAAKKATVDRESLLKEVREGYTQKDLPLKAQVLLAHKAQRVMAQYYGTEKRVEVRISPLYKPYFGNVMAIQLNGIPIYIPCDNSAYEIPESYAMEWASRMRKVDDQINREKRLGDVKKNYDGQTVGGADLVNAL